MKRFLLIIVLTFATFTAFSKAPGLHVEQMFNSIFYTNKSVSLHISKSQDLYFRGCTVSNNKSLFDKVTKLFEKDLQQATRSQDLISNGTRFRSMVIQNNGEEIYVGLSYDGENDCYLFIKGPLKAFE